jgi:uncharacterized membrane protein YbhN (UPF0104 family)
MNWRRAARIAGIGLATAAGLFLVLRIFQLRIWDHDIDFARVAPVLAALIPAYAAAVLLLGLGWISMIGNAVPLRNGVHWYVMAQLGKYLPGNIAHLAGRHYLFFKAGVPQKTLLAAAVVEAALLVAAGGSIAALFLPRETISRMSGYIPLAGWQWGIATGAATLAILLVCFVLLARCTKTRPRMRLLLPLLVYIAFFAISGSVLAGSVFALAPGAVQPRDSAPIIAAAAAAWVAGFVIPGAPGGLGIRETMLVLLLSPRFGDETALIAALLYRGTTLSGDAMAALLGFFLAGTGGNGSIDEASRSRTGS